MQAALFAKAAGNESSANTNSHFWLGLADWAKDLPETARLGMSADSQTITLRGVSFEMRRTLQILAQHTGIEQPDSVEAFLYLELRCTAAREIALKGESRYFHHSRTRRTARRGMDRKLEESRMDGFFSHLRDALVELSHQRIGSASAPTPADSMKLDGGIPDVSLRNALQGSDCFTGAEDRITEGASNSVGPGASTVVLLLPQSEESARPNGRHEKKHRKVRHDFAFSGMVTCGHCGCSMVGELKKSRYVYYHCTGYRGRCPEPYTREETIAGQFADELKQLVVPPAVLTWLQEELLASDQTEAAAREQAQRRHKVDIDRIQGRLDMLYGDRLETAESTRPRMTKEPPTCASGERPVNRRK